MSKKWVGLHTIISYSGCDSVIINSEDTVSHLIHEIACTLQVNILHEHYQKFAPVGITGFAIVSQSHIAVHTWPEYDFLSLDIYTCKSELPDELFILLKKYFPGILPDVHSYVLLAETSVFPAAIAEVYHEPS